MKFGFLFIIHYWYFNCSLRCLVKIQQLTLLVLFHFPGLSLFLPTEDIKQLS